MSKYCSDCAQALTSDGYKILLCDKHAYVDKLLAILKKMLWARDAWCSWCGGDGVHFHKMNCTMYDEIEYNIIEATK